MIDNGITVRRGAPGGDALFRRATAAWEARTFESILPELARALPTSRDHRLWHIHGLILRELERREEALPSLKRAVELNPQAVKSAHALARTLYEAGLPSIDAFGHALRLAPGDQDIVSDLALAFVGAGEVHTAVSGLEKIVARSPLWVNGHTQLSQLRWMEGERDGFTRSFSEALKLYPQAIDLWHAQITALIHAEHWDEALRVIADGRALLGDHPLFAINQAVIYAERGETAVADGLLSPFVEVDDAPLQVRIVRHHLRAGRPQQAAAIIEQWLGRPEAFMFYPYASIAWRQTDPARWQWLEGDERFVGVYDIADRLPPLDQLAETLRGLHKLSGQPLEQSLRGGTQTDGDVFMQVDPLLVRLREAVRTAVAEHAAQLPPPDPAHPLLSARRDKIAFAGAWSVRLRSAGFHSNHVHPLGWLSSALYIALPPDIGVGEAGVLTLGEPRSSCFNIDMPPFRTVEPKPGRLVLFPSYMWHGTRPFGEGERLTVAFDVARLS
ncbi:MAG: putative 2OG-Fe(II) oxygenase [Sphingomicrobium sp.]